MFTFVSFQNKVGLRCSNLGAVSKVLTVTVAAYLKITALLSTILKVISFESRFWDIIDILCLVQVFFPPS
jgi:hypothetical protein